MKKNFLLSVDWVCIDSWISGIEIVIKSIVTQDDPNSLNGNWNWCILSSTIIYREILHQRRGLRISYGFGVSYMRFQPIYVLNLWTRGPTDCVLFLSELENRVFFLSPSRAYPSRIMGQRKSADCKHSSLEILKICDVDFLKLLKREFLYVITLYQTLAQQTLPMRTRTISPFYDISGFEFDTSSWF